MKSNLVWKATLCSILISPALFVDIHDRIEYKLNRVVRDIEIISNSLNGVECTPITARMIGPDGLVIATPGHYCLTENV